MALFIASETDCLDRVLILAGFRILDASLKWNLWNWMAMGKT